MPEERPAGDFFWVLKREGGLQRYAIEEDEGGTAKVVEEWEGAIWEVRGRDPVTDKVEVIGTIEALSSLGFQYKCNLHLDLFGREEFGHRGPMDRAGKKLIERYLDKENERIAGQVERAIMKETTIPDPTPKGNDEPW